MRVLSDAEAQFLIEGLPDAPENVMTDDEMELIPAMMELGYLIEEERCEDDPEDPNFEFVSTWYTTSSKGMEALKYYKMLK